MYICTNMMRSTSTMSYLPGEGEGRESSIAVRSRGSVEQNVCGQSKGVLMGDDERKITRKGTFNRTVRLHKAGEGALNERVNWDGLLVSSVRTACTAYPFNLPLLIYHFYIVVVITHFVFQK